MKKLLRKSSALSGLVAGIMAGASLAGSLQAQSSDALLDALVKKQILTDQEAEDIKADLSKEHKEKTAKDVRFYWKDGLNFESGDGKTFKGKLGGRVQWDTAFFGEDGGLEDELGDQESSTEFRRVRLSTEGTINTSNPTFYKVELDFADADVALKDVYLGIEELPLVGSVTAGHFKEPVGLEILTSSRHITFMERALPMEAFAPERNMGLKIGDTMLQDRMTWSLGGFTDVDMSTGDENVGSLEDNLAVSGRLTGLPYYDAESKGRKLVHVGLSGRYSDPTDETARFRSRPEAHLASRFVDTGSIPADGVTVLGAEAAAVFGPFSVQGEFMNTWVSGVSGSNPNFYGFYVLGSYFLTGENRAYKTSSGAFDRVKPKKSFGLDSGGPGAWELALRYSYLDLNDAGVHGGELGDVTAGVNWYLNPNTKVMLNYVFADLDDRDDGNGGSINGEMHAFMTRLQVDF